MICKDCGRLCPHLLDYEIHKLHHEQVKLLQIIDLLDMQDRYGRVLTEEQKTFLKQLQNSQILKELGFRDGWYD